MPINNALTRWMAARIAKRVAVIVANRNPDFVVGADRTDNDQMPYLNRWYLVRRNKLANVYLHQFLRDDRDVPHDHPWVSLSISIAAPMRELYHEHIRTIDGPLTVERQRTIHFGDVVYRGARFTHRLSVPEPGAMTLFMTGPVVRIWGFACPSGWVPWKHFVDRVDNGALGKGCG